VTALRLLPGLAVAVIIAGWPPASAAAAPAAAAPAAAAARAVAPAPAPSAPDNTGEICTETAKTVEAGLEEFVAVLEQVTTSVSGGDLTGAEQSVKRAGTILIDLGAELRVDATTAELPTLAGTLALLALEFEAQGKALDRLLALQTFDVERIDALAVRMIEICGGGTSPSPSAT
jgi:3-oxoacyl-ACP reductase-like protein